MCLGHFNFYLLGEIPHFLVSNPFIRHILDWNGVRFAVALLVSHHKHKDVCCANPLFLEEVSQELQINKGLFQPQSQVRCYLCLLLRWIQVGDDSADLLLE